MNEFLAATTCTPSRPATPARRWAAGSARRSSTVADLQRREDAHRRLRRRGDLEARRRAAADRRRRHLSGAREGHRSMRPNGSGPMTTRSSASTRSRRTITIPAGGRAARAARLVTKDKWDELPKNYQAILTAAGAYANDEMMAKYDIAEPEGAARAGRRRREAQPVPAGRDGGLLQGGEGRLRRAQRPRTPTSRRSAIPGRRSAARRYLWWQVAEGNFDNFMMGQQRARRCSLSQSSENPELRAAPGCAEARDSVDVRRLRQIRRRRRREIRMPAGRPAIVAVGRDC